MNKKVSNIVLSFSAILALSACSSSTNDSYKASDNSQEEVALKSGLRGKVIADDYISGATVCIDSNKNGSCESNEKKEITDNSGVYTFDTNGSDGQLLTVEIGSNINTKSRAKSSSSSRKYILSRYIENNSAENNLSSLNITPFTSLVAAYSFSDTNKTSIIKKIENNTSINVNLLNGEDFLGNNSSELSAKNLVNSYSKAISDINDSNVSNLKILYALGQKVVENNETNVSITKNDLDDNVSQTKITLQKLGKSITWDKSYKDEIALGSDISNDKIVSYSKWHNKLTVINTSSDTLNIDSNEYYLNVDGERYAKDSSTGASEQVLSKVEVSSDGTNIYSLLEMYDNNSLDKVVGIYSDSLVAQSNKMKSEVGSDFYNGILNDIYLSKDNSLLLASNDEDNEVYIFDSNNLTSATKTISLDKSPKAVAISENNINVFVGLYKRNNSSLAIYSQDGELKSEYSLDKYPNILSLGKSNNIFVANSGDNKIYELDISDTSAVKLKNSYSVDANIKSLSITNNGNYLLVSTLGNKFNVISTSNKTINTSYTLDSSITNIFGLSSDKIAVTYGTNINYFQIKK